MRTSDTARLIDALEPAAEEHGFEIVDVQILGSAGSPILRIYIDKPDGINLDDIAGAQEEWLEAIVDEVDIIESEYTLEVSSPGIDRPLRTMQHFIDWAGEDVKLVCEPIDGRKRFTGILKGVEEGNVIVECDGKDFSIPFDSIKDAHIKGKEASRRLVCLQN